MCISGITPTSNFKPIAKKNIMAKKYLIPLLCFLSLGSALAEEDPARMTAQEFEASLAYRQGDVVLSNGVATLKIPRTFRYLGPDDAQHVLEQAWRNPHGSGTLGMLFPADVSPLAERGWGVVITYEEDGYVWDSDADSINYDELLKEMQAASAASNEERQKAGYEPVDLVGWAAKPYYDKASHKLYWAKNLKFGNAPENTLNYNIRILGRRGVLVLNAVANMSQLAGVENDMKQVLTFTDFNPEHSYAAFDPNVDKMAAYGLAALVAGGIAAKTGLITKLIAWVVAFKKVFIFGAMALGAFLTKLFGRKKIRA